MQERTLGAVLATRVCTELVAVAVAVVVVVVVEVQEVERKKEKKLGTHLVGEVDNAWRPASASRLRNGFCSSGVAERRKLRAAPAV